MIFYNQNGTINHQPSRIYAPPAASRRDQGQWTLHWTGGSRTESCCLFDDYVLTAYLFKLGCHLVVLYCIISSMLNCFLCLLSKATENTACLSYEKFSIAKSTYLKGSSQDGNNACHGNQIETHTVTQITADSCAGVHLNTYGSSSWFSWRYYPGNRSERLRKIIINLSQGCCQVPEWKITWDTCNVRLPGVAVGRGGLWHQVTCCIARSRLLWNVPNSVIRVTSLPSKRRTPYSYIS